MDQAFLERVIQSLPRTPGISGRDDYLNSAVLVPLVHWQGQWQLLFEKRTAGIRQGGEICFPGGVIRRGRESAEETAVRETMEELGLPAADIRRLGRLDTFVSPTGLIVDVVVGCLPRTDPTTLVINPGEVERIFTVPLTFFLEHEPERHQVLVQAHPYIEKEGGHREILFPAKALGLPDRYDSPWTGMHTTVLIYRFNSEIIWGITAAIVADLVRRLPFDAAATP
ncbi:MAG: CoA pyrophosphatase [Acidobacteria bacterium]|nr:CoA pyrophosphatase [Acidobacteriota bacterium]